MAEIERIQSRLSLVGYLILVAGLATSFWAWTRASNARSDATRSAMADMQNSKVYQYRLEVSGGKAAVLSENVGEWFAGLWQGRQLATTLAILSVASALMCFLVAHFLPHFPPFPPGDPGRGESPRRPR